MIKGLYTSVSGLAAAERRQQVLASNLAHVNTPGYRADDVTTESFDQVLSALYDPATPGTGAISTAATNEHPRRFDLGQGSLTQTGAPLDLALDGQGFFTLTGSDGATLYTRAGRFQRDGAGVLRTADGLAVQGVGGQPITATGAAVKVLTDGTVLSDNAIVGRLRLVNLPADSLNRAGSATFTSTTNPTPATATVVSGALENSNVDPTAVMTAMTMLLRAFEAGRSALQMQNDTLGATVNQVGSLR